ncbi:MAG: ribonuclease R family protein, partial [Cyanobacteriota bacterium]|nr:ribonuclease R family protein [Cyanobacteriota bacterium]
AYYVAPDTALDREARKRGTAIYLADKYIPILPKELSCDRMALLPDQERLTLSIFISLDPTGRLLEFEIQPSVIQVNHQIDYKTAQGILDAGEGESPEVVAILENLLEVSRAVRQMRWARGGFELNLLDTHCHFDDEGELGPIVVASLSVAQAMVSELVVLVNQVIASHLQALGLPGIYRVQPAPDAADVNELVKLAAHLGSELDLENEEEVHSADFQSFVEDLAGTKSERVLTYLLEDSLKPAAYSTTIKPHFGLALDCYTHCSAPLSRYTDIQISRVLKAIFEEGRDRRSTRSKEHVNLGHSSCHGKISWNVLPPDLQAEFESQFGQLVVHLSERESVGVDAEEDLEGLKKTGFMKARTGQTFVGLITGVQSYGFFVEIEVESPGGSLLRVEGLVHVSSLKDDWYEYRSRQQTLVGRKNRNQYRLGDNVEVQVKSVDYYRQQIDLVAVGGGSEASDESEDLYNNSF